MIALFEIANAMFFIIVVKQLPFAIENVGHRYAKYSRQNNGKNRTSVYLSSNSYTYIPSSDACRQPAFQRFNHLLHLNH